jgi:cell division protein FtsB
VVAAVWLYYRPLSSYVDTRRELAERQAEVEALRQARSELQLRLVSSTSPVTTEREARRLGYVRPGEQLFLVKGVSAWRGAQAAERAERER